MLTENEVNRKWQRLFTNADLNEDTFEKAQALLDNLRPESPLRHRLSLQLEELRQMASAKK